MDFESKITWRTETDYLRCNSMFYGKPRYDAVALKDGDRTFFGIFISVFVFKTISEEFRPFALIQPLDIVEGIKSTKDRQLHLYRLRSARRRDSIFIPLEGIVHGALLIEDPGVTGDFFIVDVIDTDWFMRCRELFH